MPLHASVGSEQTCPVQHQGSPDDDHSGSLNPGHLEGMPRLTEAENSQLYIGLSVFRNKCQL